MSTDCSAHSYGMDESARSTTYLTGAGGRSDTETSPSPSPLEEDIDPSEGFRRIGWVFGGLQDDFKRRSGVYWSDIYDSMTSKTLSAAAFMFFATLFSTIALGAHLQGAYDGLYIGVSEYLLMNGLSGLFFALASPQPLLILRPTGPITLILENLIVVSQSFNVNFWHLIACCGYCTGFYLIIVSSFELSRYTKHLTRFTHETFTCYVCSIYIYSGVKDIVEAFLGWDVDAGADNNAKAGHGSALLMASIAALTVCVCMGLSVLCKRTDQSPSWLSHCRLACLAPSVTAQGIISDNAVSVAVVMSTLVSYLPGLLGFNVFVERVNLPEYSFPPSPTAPDFKGNGRDGWTVDFADDSAGRWYTLGIAAVISLPIAFFFYVDQNLSSLLSQRPHMPGMHKGVYMHGPMLVMALCNVIGPSFGLPFVTASLPHSPQLVDALTSSTCAINSEKMSVPVCHEGRGAPVIIYSLILLTAVLPVLAPIIRSIPLGAARGVLIFVGIAGIMNTQIFARISALFCRRQWPDGNESTDAVDRFTVIQIAILIFFWVLNLSPSPAGLAVAFIVAALAPIRLKVLPSFFSDHDLDILDGGY